MSRVRQLNLLTAGAQPWNTDICSVQDNKFAYASTLAIYVYELDETYGEWQLSCILSEHRKMVNCISWHPRNADLLASCGSDHRVCVWNVPMHQIITSILVSSCPSFLAWSPCESDSLSFLSCNGPLEIWLTCDGNKTTVTYRDQSPFDHSVTHFHWHPTCPGKVLFGHANGSLSYFKRDGKVQRHFLPDGLDSETCERVSSLEWDPLSADYFLVAYRAGLLLLIDSSNMSIITTFQYPASAFAHSLEWLRSSPGMFITGDDCSGVIRLWTVGKSTSLENKKLKDKGIRSLHVIKRQPSRKNSNMFNHKVNNGPHTALPCLPDASVVCLFVDGGVGIYCLKKRKWEFLKESGHIETIFDCSFKPDDSDILATASFDGTIKLWNIGTMALVDSTFGNESIIYSISWAPADLNCIAAATSKNGVLIWNINKGKIIQRFMGHGSASIFSVSWNQGDPRRIASGGSDKTCIVHQINGIVVHTYKHPESVFGCDWMNRDILATGCEDGNVRVFNISTSNDNPLTILSGHTAKVFMVKWNPAVDSILCSGSDDMSIRVWNYVDRTCLRILIGHDDLVRGLAWCPEIPHLLVSGSWDFTCRVWDTRSGDCVDVMRDHGADVYGLCIHPFRPLLLASCSRDSTVRLWSLSPLVSTMILMPIAGRPVNSLVGSGDYILKELSLPKLCGLRGIHLSNIMSDEQEHTCEHLKLVSDILSGDVAVRNLWDLVTILQGVTDVAQLSPNYMQGITHVSHVSKCKMSMATEVEVRQQKPGGMKWEERLREAADLFLHAGSLRRYCDIMAQLGEWDQALAVAPGVSIQYWEQLTKRRVQELLDSEIECVVPYALAIGDTENLVQFHLSRGQLQDALLFAALSKEIPNKSLSNNNEKEINCESKAPEKDFVSDCIIKMADWQLNHGSPILAACCYLANNEEEEALNALLRGYEPELVVACGRLLGKGDDCVDQALVYLAYRCRRLKEWMLGVDLIKHIKNKTKQFNELTKFCASFQGTGMERNSLYQYAELPSFEECFEKACDLEINGNHTESIRYFILSMISEKGVEKGVSYILDQMKTEKWELNSVWEVLALLQMPPVGEQKKYNHLRDKIFFLSCYLGAIMAIRKKYFPIVAELIEQARSILQKDDALLNGTYLSPNIMKEELASWIKHSSGNSSDLSSSQHSTEIHRKLLQHAKCSNPGADVGYTCVAGSHLPGHSDVHKCRVTGEVIKGPAFFLEDGRTAMSLNNALMWAKVNPFSPLGRGYKINPF